MIMRKFVLTAVVAVLAVITAGAQTAGNKKPSKQENSSDIFDDEFDTFDI